MIIFSFACAGLLAMAPPPGTQTNPKAQLMQTVALMGFFIVLMWLMMFRPQQKRAKEHAALLQTLKSGDKIVTSSGIVGIIVAVKEKTVSIRSADTKLEVLKSAVTEITERASGEA
jgi:preprotein translocase subunit YajC